MASVMRRPHTAMGYTSPGVDYMDCDTKVGEDVLLPGFRADLQTFYTKASAEDKARCIELLTSIDLGETVKKEARELQGSVTPDYRTVPAPPQTERQKRPKTAMASYEKMIEVPAFKNPYNTTYNRDYRATGPPANADRPSTTKRSFHASYDLSAPVGNSTYHNEFYNKTKPKEPSIRIGSGQRRNNPHPAEAFMIWKLPQRSQAKKFYNGWYDELTDEDMDRVCRGQLTSTYQQDYLGIPQGFQVKSAFNEKDDWKAQVPFTLDSSMRYSFQVPAQRPAFKGNTTRYGCNKIKNLPVKGVVPTVSSRQMNIKTRTTYEREFSDHMGPKPLEVRDFGRHLGAQALKRHMEQADGQDKELLNKMYSTLKPPSGLPPSARSSRASSTRYRPVVPPATCIESPTPSCSSAQD